jgi:hypothetical protein
MKRLGGGAKQVANQAGGAAVIAAEERGFEQPGDRGWAAWRGDILLTKCLCIIY